MLFKLFQSIRKNLEIIFYKTSRTLIPKHDKDNILQIKDQIRPTIIFQ